MMAAQEYGIDIGDNKIVKIAEVAAEAIGILFSEVIASGNISEKVLFDKTFTELPNTNPQQYSIPALKFLDDNLPAIQEPLLDLDKRISFAAAVIGGREGE